MALLNRYLLVVLAACGVPGGEGGGGEHLPSAGAGPFERGEDPFLIEEGGYDLRDPAVAPDGTLYLSRRRRMEGEIAQIAVLVDGKAEVLFPGSAPSLLADGETWLMYFNFGTDVARAHSTDRGATWIQDGVVLADGLEPGALRAGGTTYLYVASPDRKAIHLATSEDGLVFERLPMPVLTAGVLGDPAPVGGTTATGRLHVTLFFARQSPDGWQIQAAGSFDGRVFERFANGEAVLATDPPGERGPAVALESDRATLYYSARYGVADAIAFAVQD